MCCTANAVANFFIEKSLEYNTPLTHLQIQKMIFFAHAVYFKKYHKPLIVDPVFAWKYGPVIQNLYFQLKDYGESPITKKITIPAIAPYGDGLILKTPEVNPKNTELIDFLMRAYNTLGKMTGGQLCALSHAKGGAWYKTLEDLKIDPTLENPRIPRNLVILDATIMECGR